VSLSNHEPERRSSSTGSDERESKAQRADGSANTKIPFEPCAILVSGVRSAGTVVTHCPPRADGHRDVLLASNGVRDGNPAPTSAARLKQHLAARRVVAADIDRSRDDARPPPVVSADVFGGSCAVTHRTAPVRACIASSSPIPSGFRDASGLFAERRLRPHRFDAFDVAAERAFFRSSGAEDVERLRAGVIRHRA